MTKRTLVVLLTRNGLPADADLSFLMSEVEGIIGGSYQRMSFGRETIQFDYAGPFTGPIDGCNPGDNTGYKIAEYGIRRAYEAGIDVASYRSFVFLRHDDFPSDECFNSGEGGWNDNLSYAGGILTAGVTTIGYPASFFTDPLNARSTGVYRALHEFTHSQGDIPGVSHTTVLRCYTEPRPNDGNRTNQTPVTFFDTPGQAILSNAHCDRTQPSWIDIMGLVKSEDDALNLDGIIKLKFGWLLDSNVHWVTQSETLTIRSMDREAATEETQMMIFPLPGSEKAIVLELRGAPNLGTPRGVYLYAYDDASALQPGGGVSEQYQLYTGPKLNGPINDPPDPLPVGEAVFLGNAPHVRVTVKSLADDFDQATIEVTFASDVMSPTGCECTLCVTAEEHNNGTFGKTLYDAVDQLRLTGGTICLGPGTFNLGEKPIELKGASAVRIRGQGAATILIQPKAEAAFIISGQSQLCTLDYLTICAAIDETSGPAIHLNNATGTTIERIRIIGTATDTPARTAILLEGALGQTRIRDNYLSAPFGVRDQGDPLLEGFYCEDNRIDYSNTAFPLTGAGILFSVGSHFSDTVIARNRINGRYIFGIFLNGFADTGLDVTDNIITLMNGDGIVAGVGVGSVSGGYLSMQDNQVGRGTDPNGTLGQPRDGIRLISSLAPNLLPLIIISDNRLCDLQGNGIKIEAPLDSASVEGNILIQSTEIGIPMSGLIMLAGSSADSLAIIRNRFDGVVNGIEIRSHVVSAFVEGNTFNAITGTGLVMGLGSSADSLVISGNRFDDVKVDGIVILTHVVSALVEGNTFNAIARFVLSMPFPGGSADRLEVLANEIFGSIIFLRQVSEGVISDNAINAGSLTDAAVRVDSSGSIRVSDNTITTTGPNSVLLSAASMIVSANRVYSAGTGMQLNGPAGGVPSNFVVLGNTVGGQIMVGGSALGAPWAALNVVLP